MKGPDFWKKFFEGHKAKLVFSGRQKAGDFEVEIQGLRAIPGGIEYFARAWDLNGNRIGFGKNGTVDLERFRVFNPPTMVPDGTKTKVVSKMGQVVELNNYKEDVPAAILEDLGHTIKVIPKHGPEKIESGKVGNTTTTLYPDATAIDGDIYNAGEVTFAAARDATAGDAANNAPSIAEVAANFQVTYNVRRAFVTFPTGSIGAGQVISAVTLSLCGSGAGSNNADTSNVNIVSSTPASTTTLVVDDFDQIGATVFASMAISSYVNSGGVYNDFSLDANGIANTSVTANSKFAVRISRDTDNAAPTGLNEIAFQGSGYAGTTRDPKLVVTHAAVLTRSVSDSVGIAESLSRAATYPRTRNEDMTTLQGETIGRTTLYPRDLGTESVGISETFNGLKSRILDLLDGMPIGDTLSRFYQAVRSPSDQVDIAESQSRAWSLSRALSESVGISENLTTGRALIRTILESIGITESMSRSVTYARGLPAESVGVTDSLSYLKSRILDLVDLVAITENAVETSRTVIFFNRVVSDAVSIIEHFATPLNWIKRTKPTATWIPRQKP